MDKLHHHQKEILIYLLFHPNISFTKMNIEGLTSDHFTYHIKSLVSLGYVGKDNKGMYFLTTKGKEYANTYDTDNKIIEKQPKYAVFLVAKRMIGGIEHLMIQRRLKEPYYGYQGFITGKVRFGEDLTTAAKRELTEETGLTGNFKFIGTRRDIVFSKESKELLEDKVFNIFVVTNCKGKLVKSFDGGENYWLSESSFATLNNKYYNEDELYESSKRKPFFLEEKNYYVEEF